MSDSPESREQSTSSVLRVREALIVVAAAIFPFLLLPPKGFVSETLWLDQAQVPHSESVEAAVIELPEALAAAEPAPFRPLVSESWRLQSALWRAIAGDGPSPPIPPRALHLVDMSLHALAALLVACIGSLLVRERRWALVAGALFGAHPLVTHAVCSFVGRSDLLVAAGVLGAMLARLAPVGGAWARGAVVSLLAALALFSGPAGLLVLPGLAFADAIRASSPGSASAGRRADVVSWAIVLVLAGAQLSLLALGSAPLNPRNPLPWLGESLYLALAPTSLSHHYDPGFLEASGAGGAAAVGALAIVAALGALAFWIRERHCLLALVLAALGAILGIALGETAAGEGIFAERMLYLPLALVVLALALLVDALAERIGFSRTGLVFGALLVAVGVAQTSARVQDWGSRSRLVRSALEADPGALMPNVELARHLAAAANPRRDPELSRRHLERAAERLDALEIPPAEVRRLGAIVSFELAPLLAELGAEEAATEAFLEARRAAPSLPRAGPMLARAILTSSQRAVLEGNQARARALIEVAIDATALPPEGRFLAGQIAARIGDEDRARELFSGALAEDPDLLRRRHRQAVENDREGRHAEAAALFLEILAAQPDHVTTLFNLGRSLVLAGRPADAIGPLQRGLQLRDDPAARRWLARARREAAAGP